jgi:CheY-like chemotaxis protein
VVSNSGFSTSLATPLSSGAKILVIDDESAIREVLSATLADEGYDVRTARSGE